MVFYSESVSKGCGDGFVYNQSCVVVNRNKKLKTNPYCMVMYISGHNRKYWKCCFSSLPFKFKSSLALRLTRYRCAWFSVIDTQVVKNEINLSFLLFLCEHKNAEIQANTVRWIVHISKLREPTHNKNSRKKVRFDSVKSERPLPSITRYCHMTYCFAGPAWRGVPA